MSLIPPLQLNPQFSYMHHPHHRNGQNGKSQWSISQNAELTSFSQSINKGWLQNTVAWGLHVPIKSPAYLGYAQDHVTQVFVAKFVGGQTGQWHGYPADHQRCHNDIPDEIVLSEWMLLGLLTPAKLRKLARGQRCSL